MNTKNLSLWNWFKKEDENDVRSSAPPSFFYPLYKVQNEIDRLFNSFFQGENVGLGDRMVSSLACLKPNIDIIEKDKEYQVDIEVPGVNEKDVTLTLSGDTLTVRGEKKLEEEDKGVNYHRIERSYGAFQRAITLPQNADPSKIEAIFKNGVLTVHIGKSKEVSSQEKRIELKKSA